MFKLLCNQSAFIVNIIFLASPSSEVNAKTQRQPTTLPHQRRWLQLNSNTTTRITCTGTASPHTHNTHFEQDGFSLTKESEMREKLERSRYLPLR